MATAAKPNLALYSYWRSSCSHRVRLGLQLKGLEYEYKAVNLLKGEQFNPEFEKINPAKCVPVLVDGDVVLADSLAILLYLEDKYQEKPLLPHDLKKKGLNLQIASVVCSGIQPLQNLVVVKIIEDKLGSEEKLAWTIFHIKRGFAAIEKLLEQSPGKYATGDEVYLADVFLAPQLYSAVKYEIDMTPYPILSRLHETYLLEPSFQAAVPEQQPDATSSS